VSRAKQSHCERGKVNLCSWPQAEKEQNHNLCKVGKRTINLCGLSRAQKQHHNQALQHKQKNKQ